MDKDFYKDLEKIKTIGSTYMAAVGLAPTTGTKVSAVQGFAAQELGLSSVPSFFEILGRFCSEPQSAQHWVRAVACGLSIQGPAFSRQSPRESQHEACPGGLPWPCPACPTDPLLTSPAPSPPAAPQSCQLSTMECSPPPVQNCE